MSVSSTYAERFSFVANQEVVTLVFITSLASIAPSNEMYLAPEIVAQVTMSHDGFKRLTEACNAALAKLPNMEANTQNVGNMGSN